MNPRVSQVADSLAIARTGNPHETPDQRDYQAAEHFLALFPDRGPCPRCTSALRAAVNVLEASRGPLLACGECKWTGTTGTALAAHTSDKHNREPSKSERTPVGVEGRVA